MRYRGPLRGQGLGISRIGSDHEVGHHPQLIGGSRDRGTGLAVRRTVPEGNHPDMVFGPRTETRDHMVLTHDLMLVGGVEIAIRWNNPFDTVTLGIPRGLPRCGDAGGTVHLQGYRVDRGGRRQWGAGRGAGCTGGPTALSMNIFRPDLDNVRLPLVKSDMTAVVSVPV